MKKEAFESQDVMTGAQAPSPANAPSGASIFSFEVSGRHNRELLLAS